MERTKIDWRRRYLLLVRDPWFWGSVVIGAVLVATVDQLLPEPWDHWAVGAVFAVVIMTFDATRGDRHHD